MRKYIVHITIILSALAFVCTVNMGYTFYVLGLLNPKKIGQLAEGETGKVNYFIWWLAINFIAFYGTFLFNYFWRYKFIQPEFSRRKKQFATIAINILFLIILGVFVSVLSKIFFDFAQDISLSTYLLKLLYVQVPAIFLAYFLTTFRISKEREMEVKELKEENRQAEIQALKEQISPHFLFNTFSSLSALIRTDKKNESLEFIQSLSDVYRYILESQHKNLVSISEEIKFLKAYIYLLEKRFEHNLVVNILIDENKMQDSIPPLALQILVENAVKHNKLTNKVPLKIKIERTANFIAVQNNYNPKFFVESNGIGLINLAKRFHLISNQEIKINKDDKIFSVTIPVILS